MKTSNSHKKAYQKPLIYCENMIEEGFLAESFSTDGETDEVLSKQGNLFYYPYDDDNK